MKKASRGFLFLALAMGVISENPVWGFSDGNITFSPVSHATFVIQSGENAIYVDPVGSQSSFEKFNPPTIILITDIHPDHFNKELVAALKTDKTMIVGSKATVDQLGEGFSLNNGENKTIGGVLITAVPSYNISKDRLMFHPKGRGNGYVLSMDGKKIYISGDTEDIPEMRQLKNIDYAFVCMNLPYTMTVDQAASAVLEFEPRIVIPYHYRGTGGMSDIEKFKELVKKNRKIKVEFLKWY
ncbi:MBL fold metallo-hydrolase [bacterium]|nr:MBL fold metallo-hydrolase [bacterium]